MRDLSPSAARTSRLSRLKLMAVFSLCWLLNTGSSLGAELFGIASSPEVVVQDASFLDQNEIQLTSSFEAMTARPPEPQAVVFADLLFWTVREGSADNWAQEITAPGSGFGTATLIDAPFDWKAGLRVGFEKPVGDENARAKVYYTNYSTQAENHAAGEVYSAFLGNFFVGNPDGVDFGPHYESASMQWDFDFHTLDLELGRDLTVSESLTLQPFVGLKAAIINQFAHSTWHSPIDTSTETYLFDSAVENLQHDFWGIGPSLGMTATMACYTDQRSSLKIFATPSAALMYGHWQFDQRYQNDGPTSTTFPVPTSIAIDMSPIDGAATMVRGVLGLEWTQEFARTTTTLRLGYEAQVWLNQMQNYSFNMGRLNNLSSLQGGILELSIGF